MEPLPLHKVERLQFFLKDDKQALLFCLDLLYIAHKWDDLIDGDKELEKEEINQAFVKCLAGVPSNPFYQEFQAVLMPMMYNALTLWLESNELKKGDVDERLAGFTIEHTVVEIIHFCILMKGQIDWAREVAPEFWQLFGPTMDELNECLEAEDV